MLNFRIGTLGPLWLEEFVFFVADETRRFPRRLAAVANTLAEKGLAAAQRPSRPPTSGTSAQSTAPASRIATHEAALLDEPLAWTLATDPLTASASGAAAAIAFHAAAAEQLDALTYGLDRLRDELRPLMTYARIEGDTPHRLEPPGPSIEALLELARENSKTRPKERLLAPASQAEAA